MTVLLITKQLPRMERDGVVIAHYGDAFAGRGFERIIVLQPPIDESQVVTEKMRKWLDHLPAKLLHGGKFIIGWGE